ncbi:hypothetical protein YERSI8AC_290135 [Enterobacterales bacterium 8AC]|nr:hypothetical protein YERSI8AC_290135 [Enterobacterales bacterium 8AC]
MMRLCVASCVKQASLLVMLVRLNVRKSACVKHVVVRSSPSVNSCCLGSAFYAKNPVPHRVFLCLKFLETSWKSAAWLTIQHEIAAWSPQESQNLVNYDPLLRLFAVQLLSVYLRGPFLDPRFICELQACGQDYSE